MNDIKTIENIFSNIEGFHLGFYDSWHSDDLYDGYTVKCSPHELWRFRKLCEHHDYVLSQPISGCVCILKVPNCKTNHKMSGFATFIDLIKILRL